MITIIGKIALSFLIAAVFTNLIGLFVKYDHENPFGDFIDRFCGFMWFLGFPCAALYLILKIWL